MTDGVIYQGSTAFDEYTVVEEQYNNRPARVLYSKARIAAQSGLPLDGQPELLFDYNERFIELFRGLDPDSILVIGGGAFTFPKAVLEEKPNIKLTVVEIDEGLIKIAQDYFGFKPSKSTQIYISDGQTYVRQMSYRYDLIIIDAFVGPALPPALQTEEFTANLSKCLQPKGVVAMNLITGLHGQRAGVLQRQVAVMRSNFSYLEVFPAGQSTSFWLPQNFILATYKQSQALGQYLRYEAVTLAE